MKTEVYQASRNVRIKPLKTFSVAQEALGLAHLLKNIPIFN